MYSHVMVGSDDLDRAKQFYDPVLAVLGAGEAATDGARMFWVAPTGMFAVTRPINGAPATAANGGTIGFACESPQQVDAWHAAGVANGGVSCEDPPGWRESAFGPFYLAYLRDPDGNKLCAMHAPAPA